MASEFMKWFESDKTKHAVAGSTSLKATTSGHIFNIKATADIDNGCIVKKGEYKAPEYYAEDTASSTFAGKVIGQAANGNWLVEVTKCEAGDCLVLSVPLGYSDLDKEDSFYNKKDDLMRCYELYIGDVFELSKEGFTGNEVAVNKTLSVVSKKLNVGD